MKLTRYLCVLFICGTAVVSLVSRGLGEQPQPKPAQPPGQRPETKPDTAPAPSAALPEVVDIGSNIKYYPLGGAPAKAADVRLESLPAPLALHFRESLGPASVRGGVWVAASHETAPQVELRGIREAPTVAENGLRIRPPVLATSRALLHAVEIETRSTLLPGDILLRLGDRDVHHPGDAAAALERSAGAPLPIELIRNGRKMLATVVCLRQPTKPVAPLRPMSIQVTAVNGVYLLTATYEDRPGQERALVLKGSLAEVHAQLKKVERDTPSDVLGQIYLRLPALPVAVTPKMP